MLIFCLGTFVSHNYHEESCSLLHAQELLFPWLGRPCKLCILERCASCLTSFVSWAACPLAFRQSSLKCGSDNAHYLSLLQQHAIYNAYVPYGWGFTIYRAAFGGPDSDARFAAGLRRLESWVRFEVLNYRYKRNGEPQDRSDPDPSALLAERFWNEVVEEYPDTEKNVSSGGGGRGGSVV